MPAFHINGPAQVSGFVNGGAIAVTNERGEDLFFVPRDHPIVSERTAEFAAAAYTIVDGHARLSDIELRRECRRAVAL